MKTEAGFVDMAYGIGGSFPQLGSSKGNPFIAAINKNPKTPSSRWLFETHILSLNRIFRMVAHVHL